jgi:hypothetical protein
MARARVETGIASGALVDITYGFGSTGQFGPESMYYPYYGWDDNYFVTSNEQDPILDNG